MRPENQDAKEKGGRRDDESSANPSFSALQTRVLSQLDYLDKDDERGERAKNALTHYAKENDENALRVLRFLYEKGLLDKRTDLYKDIKEGRLIIKPSAEERDRRYEQMADTARAASLPFTVSASRVLGGVVSFLGRGRKTEPAASAVDDDELKTQRKFDPK